MNNNMLVVDANIMIKLVVDEEDSDIAEALFNKWKIQRKLLIAPALFVYEATNIFWQKVRQDKMSIDQAKTSTSLILNMGLALYWPDDLDLSIRALTLAHTFKLPATYDAHYLTLAEREQCEFWTADARLYHAVREQLAWVRLMADDPAASTPA